MLDSMSMPSKTPPGAGAMLRPPTHFDASRYDDTFKKIHIPRSTRRLPSPPADTTADSVTSTARTSLSAHSSPYLTPYPTYDCSPDRRRGAVSPDRIDLKPLQLPDSHMESSTSTTTESPTSTRQPGLIRRISNAGQRRLRGRSSASNVKHPRDQHAGSVVRRRSDSRGIVDGCYEVSDEEDDQAPVKEEDDGHTPLYTEGVVVERRPRLFSLSRRSSATDMNAQRTPPRSLSRRSSANDTTQKPTPTPLPTIFVKINRKKRKQIRFTLDDVAAKMCWSSSTNTRKQVYIDDIREVRRGADALNYMDGCGEPSNNKNCWLTLIYSDPSRTKGHSMMKLMHLVAPDEHTCDTWYNALRHLMKTRDDFMVGMAGRSEKHWIACWQQEMSKRFGRNEYPETDEKIDFNTLRRMCRSFSIFKSDRDLQLHFNAVGGLRTINKFQYIEFFRRLTERPEVRRIFDNAKKTTSALLSFEEFLEFLTKTQKIVVDDSNRSQWEDIFMRCAARGRTPQDEGAGIVATAMSLDGFQCFLSDRSNLPLTPKPASAELTRPLNEYFISSSHNTYLQGRQILGESSVEMYTEALKRGCRCIEIDCDNGMDGRPVVTHVRTGTSRVLFADCIKAIDQHAFASSEYPLIISLEVHCNTEQQKVMADIIRDTFGTKLLLKPLAIHSANELPSPEQLKGKILVKVKMPKPDQPLKMPVPRRTAGHNRHRSVSAPNPPGQALFMGPMMTKSPTLPVDPMAPQLESMMLATSMLVEVLSPPAAAPRSLSGSEESDSSSDNTSTPTKGKHASNIVKDLGELGVYTCGVKFNDWKSFESQMPNHVYSFNESTFENKCTKKEGRAALEAHNLRHLMRVYPKATRWQSGNFNPLHFWRRGVQMVATNWQTYDLGTQLNDAMFAAGLDRSGYVLKPAELRQPRQIVYGERQKLERKQVKFSINLISAQYLEAPADMRQDADMNPYVVLEMFYPEDKAKDLTMSETGNTTPRSVKAKRTDTVVANGYNPVFDAEESNTFTMIPVTKHPDLIFVRFSIFSAPDNKSASRGDALCTFTAKLSSLEQGYRHLPLYSKNGELLHSRLFVKVHREEPRPLNAEETVGGSQEPIWRPDDNARSGMDKWRRWLNRTPSEKRKTPRDDDRRRPSEKESGYFSRASSSDRQS